MIETRLLRYVVEVAEQRSFTRAADQLRVAQPTLSTQVRQVEDAVGCTLIDRSDRRLRLTPAGEEFVARARRILAEVADLEAALRDHRDERAGRLRLGAVQTVAATLLPPVLARFRAAFPAIRLLVEELPAPDLGDRLRAGDLDLGLGFASPPEPDLRATPLFTEELVLFGRPQLLDPLPDPIPDADLAALPLALLDERFCTRRLAAAWATDRALRLAPAYELTAIEGLLAVVRAAPVATILPHLAVRLPGAADLSVRRLASPAPRRDVVLLARPSLAATRRVVGFEAALREVLTGEEQGGLALADPPAVPGKAAIAPSSTSSGAAAAPPRPRSSLPRRRSRP